MNNVIVGIDLSLSSTGIAVLNENGDSIHMESIPTKKLKGMERISFIKSKILDIIKKYNAKNAVIEYYSFQSKGRSGVSLGELGGSIRLALYENGIDYIDCSPKTLKSYTIGNAAVTEKEAMRLAIFKKYGVDISNNDICDAYALAKMRFELGDRFKEVIVSGGMERLRKEEVADIVADYYSGGYADILKRRGDSVKILEKILKDKDEDEKISEYLGITEEEASLLMTSKSKASIIKDLVKKYSGA